MTRSFCKYSMPHILTQHSLGGMATARYQTLKRFVARFAYRLTVRQDLKV